MKKVQDATVISTLSLEQITYLYNKIPLLKLERHGLEDSASEYFCEVSDMRHQAGRKYPKGFTLGKKRMRGDWDATHFDPNKEFSPAQIVLAANGVFASNALSTVSHLCANPFCLRVEHLCYETLADNLERRYCSGTVKCPSCDYHVVCKHEPKCKKLTL